MSRRDEQRLEDVLAAARAIAEHLRRGGLDDGLVFDAVRVRLIEIGEAVKAIDPALLAREPDVPWIDVAAMRNHLAHRYFDTAHAIVQADRRPGPPAARGRRPAPPQRNRRGVAERLTTRERHTGRTGRVHPSGVGVGHRWSPSRLPRTSAAAWSADCRKWA